jgi:hypothetical protein
MSSNVMPASHDMSSHFMSLHAPSKFCFCLSNEDNIENSLKTSMLPYRRMDRGGEGWNECPYVMRREGIALFGADVPTPPYINPSTEMGHMELMTTIPVAAIIIYFHKNYLTNT